MTLSLQLKPKRSARKAQENESSVKDIAFLREPRATHDTPVTLVSSTGCWTPLQTPSTPVELEQGCADAGVGLPRRAGARSLVVLALPTCEFVFTLVVSTDSGPVRNSSSSFFSRSSTLIGWADMFPGFAPRRRQRS